MLKCLFIRRKLYGYFDNALSEMDRIKVKSHLDVCDECRHRLSQIKNIIDLATQKKIPQPNAEFWHNLKVDLDRRLNEILVPPIRIGHKPSYRLRPAFAYIATLILILVVGNYFYKNLLSIPGHLTQDEELIEEIVTLQEIDEALQLNYDENAYIEELNLLFQLDQA